jgi:putative heme-binding domain-containing protein
MVRRSMVRRSIVRRSIVRQFLAGRLTGRPAIVRPLDPPARFVRRAAWLLGGLTITTATLLTLALLPLRAQELRERRPLPKFLRSATLAQRYLSTRDLDEVMSFERVEPVCLELVKRAGVPSHTRREALETLAQLRGTDTVQELTPWIEHWDELADQADQAQQTAAVVADEVEAEEKVAAADVAESEGKEVKAARTTLAELAELLAQQPRTLLTKHRATLERLAREGKQAASRQGGLVGLIVADGRPDAAWQLGIDQPDLRLDFVKSLRWLPGAVPREALYGLVQPLAIAAESPELRRAAIETIGTLDVNPRETFELLADTVAQGQMPVACAKSICAISSDHWTEDRRGPLADGLLDHLQQVPLAQRTSDDSKLVVKLVNVIAQRLPSEQAAPRLRRLAGITVREITVRALEEQMAYDQTVLVVQAGQGVQIRFENDDIMPHNLVIVDSPAAREEVGIAADQMQNEPDALAKGYLPPSDHILHHTRLVYPQNSETLTFTAPTTPGTYAYVCTFPGHWIKMYGALLVVDDVRAYLALHPSLPTADELLGIKTVEWTYEQLASELVKLSSGRSYENGKRNFLKASCYACHQMQGEGGRIGPELTKITETYKTPAEVLRHILDPSEKVDERYATAIIETASGQVLRGVIVSQTDTEIQLNENPLASCDAQVISKDDVEQVTRSRLSPMPSGLLNTLTEPEDVLDLLAYLISGGNPTHSCFQ